MMTFQWVSDMKTHRDASDYLRDNETGASVGGVLGATAAVSGLVAFAVVTTGPAVAASASAAGSSGAAAAAAAGGEAARRAFVRGYTVGQKMGKGARALILGRNGLEAVAELGKTGGAYTGASVQHCGRWCVDRLRNS